MSAFEQQLNQEIEKRGLTKTREEEASSSGKSSKKNKVISFKSFCAGLVLGGLFLLALSGWAWFQSAETLQAVQGSLPSKTAIVKRGMENAQTASIQPVLTMQPAGMTQTDTQEMIADQTPRLPAPESQNASDTAQDFKRNQNGLVPAPVPDLYETSPAGPIPVAGRQDGVTPFDAYKRPFKPQEGKIKLSVVISDVGLSQAATTKIINDFPPDVTLAFSPYGTTTKILVDQAREAGHEAWLVLPMETSKYPIDDPGPSTLLLNASVAQNQQRLTSVLASANGYVGFVAQKNHAFRAEDSMTNPSISEIFERGLAIADSNTNVDSFVARAAARNNYPHVKNNFWLDDNLTPLALNQKIRQLIEYGQIHNSAVIMLNAYPASLNALQKFLNSAAAQDFQLAPLSAQVTYGQ